MGISTQPKKQRQTVKETGWFGDVAESQTILLRDSMSQWQLYRVWWGGGGESCKFEHNVY